MKFITNIYNPSLEDAERTHLYMAHSPQGMRDEWQQRLKWVNQFVIGEPQMADVEGAYTVEQLKEMGMVGLYAKDSNSGAGHPTA